ncbi:cytochrome b [Pseudomonas machongensis]
MQLRDTGLRYSAVTIVLHWLGTLGLVALLVLQLTIGSHDGDPLQADLLKWQNLVGLIVWVVSIYRLWARWTSFHPLPVGTPNPIEVIISRSVAFALVLAMVLLPIAIWASRATAGVAVELPGGLSLPLVFSPNPGLKRFVDVAFNIGASAFLAGLALHLFGAMKNHFVLKNDTLKRMLGKHVEL